MSRWGGGRCIASLIPSSEAVLDSEDAMEGIWVREGVALTSRVERLVVLRWERRVRREVEPCKWNWER